VSAYDILPANAATDFNPLTGDFTVEAFIYTEIVYTVNPLVRKLDTSSSSNRGWALWIKNTNQIRVTFQDGTFSPSINSNVIINKNTWLRLAVVFDRGGNMTIYINGVVDNFANISSVSDSVYNDIDLVIGMDQFGPHFGGLISELKYSNVARTPAEINDSYINGFTSDSSTVGLWRPDSHGIFRDVANGNDLTAVDTTNSEFVYLPRDEGIVANDVSGAAMRDIGKVKYNTDSGLIVVISMGQMII